MLARWVVMMIFSATSGWAQCVPAPDGLVAWWPLDETSGSEVRDIVGRRDGTLADYQRGIFPEPVAGQVRGALRFHGDAGADHVSVPDDAAFHFGLQQKFTIAAWIRSDPGSSFQPVVAKTTFGPTDLPYGWMLSLRDC